MIRKLLLLAAAGASLGFNVVRDVGGDGPIVFATPSVTMELQQNGSADIGDGSDLQAIRDAMNEWNQVACSSFQFVDGGTGTSRGIGADGINRITFLENNWPGYAAGAGAFTLRERVSGSPDRWTEFDIQINGQDTSWATDGSAQLPDIRSAVVHELGHGLGLQHASHPEASMYFSVRLGTTFARTLHADDAAGVCYLYPAQSFSCSTDDECPLLHGSYGGPNARTRCSGGTCVEGSAAPYGSGCFESGHCASGLCLVDPLEPPASEPGFCSEPCPSGTCPSGDYCASTSSGPRCIVGRDDCAEDADCGGNPNVCARQLDGRFTCQRLCLRNSACMSVPGAVCHGGTGENPAGFCRVPGAGAPGTPCEHGLECASLSCSTGGVQPTCDDSVPGYDGTVLPPPDASVPDTAVLPNDAGRADAASRDAGGPLSDDAETLTPGRDAGVTIGLDTNEAPIDLVGSGCRCTPQMQRHPWSFALLLFGVLGLAPRRRLRKPGH
jgi:MYXO-CTERM domain-containing protein